MTGVDLLAGLLDGPRARGAFVLRTVLAPPWSLRVEDRSPLTVAAVVAGEAWVHGDDGAEPVRLAPGDVAIARGVEPYTLADPPGRPPDVIVHHGQRCATPDGVDLHDAMVLGVRTWGNDPDGSTVLLVGAYAIEGEVGRRLLDALPVRCVVRSGAAERRLIDLLVDEATRDRAGQQAVLDRLLDLLLIDALRGWFDGQEHAPAWYRGQADPIVGPALRALHERPEAPWTVASLACEVGVSRPTLARHFTAIMGEGPMGYLAGWRMALAADLLAGPGATVTGVANRLGYATPFAFSAAFKRSVGVSPSQYAARARGVVGGGH